MGLKYNRILLKISGEALGGEKGMGFDEAAMDAWMATYDVTLGYLLVPRELTGGDAVSQRLMQMGLGAYYYLELGYTLTSFDLDHNAAFELTVTDNASGDVVYHSDTADTAGGGRFSPDNTVTRAEAVTFLWRAQGRPEPSSSVSPFKVLTASFNILQYRS